MEQIFSWETKRSSAGQEIPRVSWNSNVHPCTHNSPPPVAVLRQISAVRAAIPPLEGQFEQQPLIYS